VSASEQFFQHSKGLRVKVDLLLLRSEIVARARVSRVGNRRNEGYEL